ncbi:MAG: sulfatase-like hydrolase/transferase [Bacteroidota bacterium]
MKKLILGFYCIFLFCFISCRPEEKYSTPDNKPNIIVIVADDLGWNDIGYHGSEIHTPSIDKLAREGIEMDRFYVHSVCSPTRASLLTGRYPSRYGILSPLGDESVFPTGTVTIAELLQGNGYETAISGKWHLGTVPEARPMKLGFNSSYGYLRGQIDPYTHLYKNGNRTWHRNDSIMDEEGHATDLITNEAIRIIEKPCRDSVPFFLYVAYSVPHYPLHEDDQWMDHTIENESRRLYAASVTHMDDCIGQIMTVIEENELEENTIVLFFSDNGGQESWHSNTQYNGKFKGNDVLGDNTPLRDWKTSLYDGALRVPALLTWKGKVSPGKVTEPINVADIFPTFAALAGADISKELTVDGIDFWPSIEGESLSGERVMYWRMNNGSALRHGNWKLIHKGSLLDEGVDELYNISKDPYETTNVAVGNEEKVLKLKQEMIQQRSLDQNKLAEEIQ